MAGMAIKESDEKICEAFLEPGDEVLLFSPAFPTYEPNARFAYHFLVRNGTPYFDSTNELCVWIKRNWHPTEPLATTVAIAAKVVLKFDKVERFAAKLRELGVDPDAI